MLFPKGGRCTGVPLYMQHVCVSQCENHYCILFSTEIGIGLATIRFLELTYIRVYICVCIAV